MMTDNEMIFCISIGTAVITILFVLGVVYDIFGGIV